MRQQRRDLTDREVVLAPVDQRFGGNRWVRLHVAEPGARITAVADPVRNRLTLTTHGVRQLDLLLGPALVDGRDFTLVVDGREEQVALQPDLDLLLDVLEMRYDPGALFTARRRVVIR